MSMSPPPLPPPPQQQQPQPTPVLPYSGPPGSGGPPCPKCGFQGSSPVSFTWWGGLIGPKMLSHVRCNACRYCYNGKTGRSNTTGIVIYTVVGAAICAVLLLALGLLG
jgi:hypothetical protein